MYTHLAWFCMKSWEEKDLGESLTLDIRMWHVSFDQSQWSILIFRISSKSIYSFDYKIQSDLPKSVEKTRVKSMLQCRMPPTFY